MDHVCQIITRSLGRPLNSNYSKLLDMPRSTAAKAESDRKYGDMGKKGHYEVLRRQGLYPGLFNCFPSPETSKRLVSQTLLSSVRFDHDQKNKPVSIFNILDSQTLFSPQGRALFADLNFQKSSNSSTLLRS